MSRREFPASVKKARLKQVTRDGNVYCEGCGVQLKPGDFDFDHDKPDAMGGEPTLDNCRVLGRSCCHSDKSKRDQERLARAQRQESVALHMPSRKAPIESKPFARKHKRQPRTDTLPPRALYAPKDARR